MDTEYLRGPTDIPTAPSTPLRSHGIIASTARRRRLLRRASIAPLPLHLYPNPSASTHIAAHNSPNAGEAGLEQEVTKSPNDIAREVVSGVLNGSSQDLESGVRPATPTGLEFHEGYLSRCKLNTFNPQTLRMSNIDILFTLGRLFGPGITMAQFRQIMRRCTLCQHVCFVERRHLHCCQGRAILTQSNEFDLVLALSKLDEHSGLSSSDLQQLLILCQRCERIFLSDTIHFHDCTLSNPPFPTL
ncbi:hypothetical protein NMY22_g12427 [Coprinellus aureogranulatus]|nr:hypothetical protein NMY22_g12427 [Coprinellus aureogranulatus]